MSSLSLLLYEFSLLWESMLHKSDSGWQHSMAFLKGQCHKIFTSTFSLLNYCNTIHINPISTMKSILREHLYRSLNIQ